MAANARLYDMRNVGVEKCGRIEVAAGIKERGIIRGARPSLVLAYRGTSIKAIKLRRGEKPQ